MLLVVFYFVFSINLYALHSVLFVGRCKALSHSAMRCQVVSCGISCRVTGSWSVSVMWCQTVSCGITQCHAVSHAVSQCHVVSLSCGVKRYHVVSHSVMRCHVMSCSLCYVVSNGIVVSHNVMWCQTVSCGVCHAVSHSIMQPHSVMCLAVWGNWVILMCVCGSLALQVHVVQGEPGRVHTEPLSCCMPDGSWHVCRMS